MTGAAASPDPARPTAGVLPGQEGLILQQGGEELRLVKVGDRFTIRLTTPQPLEHLTAQLGATRIQPVPGLQLLEVQVDPAGLEATMQQARGLGSIAFASHIYAMEDSPLTFLYLTNELTVQFVSTMTTEAIRAIAQAEGLRAMKPVAGVPQTYVFEVTPQATVNPIKLANRLMRRPEVLVAEPNVAIRTEKLYRPVDPDYIRQWYLHNNGGKEIAPNSHISVEAAWDITRGDRSVVVAIADDGFDLNHPDFQGVGKLVSPKDLRRNDALPLPETASDNHGTACAGIAIAEENGRGVVGVAPGCSFMPIRTSGVLDDQAIETLVDWVVQNNAAVLSCSWGPSAVKFPLSLRRRAAITRAATQGRNGRGCVVVFAAGNANRPIDGTINEQGWPQDVLKGETNWLNGFTVHPDVIAVAACTSLGKKAAYSNWGAAIAVCAPSNNAPPGTWFPQTGYVFTPPVVQGSLPGVGMFTSDRLGAAGYTPSDYTGDFGGTSSACPVVAGVAALVLSANPYLTAREVKQILQQTADKITDPDPDPQLGFRYGTYDANGHSQWFGYGRVNAARAVLAARHRLTPLQPVTRWVTLPNDRAIAIPDAIPQGVTSLIQVSETAPLRDLQITVDVEHTFMGDLEISLIPPQGAPILLQSRTAGRLTRLQTTYDLRTTPALRLLLNQPARGTWQLRLIDLVPQNTGSLRRWQLALGLG